MPSVPTAKSSGTQSATISTEHTLLSTTDAGVYVMEVDTNAMASGDTLELRIKKKVLSGGTVRGGYVVTYSGAQSADDIIKVSVPITTDVGADFTLKQTAGTGRSFPWKILAL